MRDLTRGSIPAHLIALAVPMTLGTAMQMLYVLVDLFFVAQLGEAAVAGVTSASTLLFLIVACTQTISVGAAVGIAQAAGRRDSARIRWLFAQALCVGVIAAVAMLVCGYLAVDFYAAGLAADPAVQAAAASYMRGWLPGLVLPLPNAALTGLLRGMGDTSGIARVQVITLLTNIVLAPLLISGFGTSCGLGVFGAGLATSLSVALSLVLLIARALGHKGILPDVRQLVARPKLAELCQLLKTGLPAGGEYLITYCNLALVLWIAGRWGTDAQAGAGIGVRVLHALLAPALSVAYSAAIVAGHSFGARNHPRVQQTFRSALVIITGVMASLTILCQWQAPFLVQLFTQDTNVARLASQLVQVMALSFIAQGIVQSCAGLFQAMGKTLPVFISALTQLCIFATGLPWLLAEGGADPIALWQWASASIFIQAGASSLLLVPLWRSLLDRAH
jgi:putative MATE family efflux protein